MGETRSVRQPAAGLLAGGRRAATSGKGVQRSRSRGLVILAAVLVVGMGLAVAGWGLAAGKKESVLAVREPIAKGHIIDRGDLVTKAVAGVEGALTVDEVARVVGKTAAVDLVAGQIITEKMIAARSVPGPGQATVGLALDPSRLPGEGLVAGDVVDAILTPGSDGGGSFDDPTVLAQGAQVMGVQGSATAGGLVIVTLVVSDDDAHRIAAYSTAKRVAIVEAAR